MLKLNKAKNHASITSSLSSFKRRFFIKQKVFSLKKYIDDHIERRSLTHIDAVPDNFLIYNNENNIKEVKLIDFEYSGMQDPHVDIAMFCIYSLYNKKQIEIKKGRDK